MSCKEEDSPGDGLARVGVHGIVRVSVTYDAFVVWVGVHLGFATHETSSISGVDDPIVSQAF